MARVDGNWDIIQSNNTVVRVELRQTGDTLSGTAQFRSTSGTVDIESRMTGDRLVLVINWSDGHVGEYNGTIGALGGANGQGRLTGVTFDRTDTSSQASWFSSRTFAP
jgi:hypothetical protein